MLVDPDHAAVDALGDRQGSLGIGRPDRAAETVFAVVGARDHLVNAVVWQDRHQRSELFLAHQARVVWNVTHDRRRNEVARPFQRRPTCNDFAACTRLVQKTEQLLVLHAVLDRTDLGLGLETIADNGIARERCQRITHGAVELRRNIDALGGEANLTRIEHGSLENARRKGRHIDVVEHDGCIIAAQLEREALEGARAAFHYLPSGGSGSGERDLGDVRVPRQHATEIIGVNNNVQDTWRQDRGRHLAQQHRRQRRGRRRLGNDGVPRDQRWRNLWRQHQHGEVPGGDGCHNPQRGALLENASPGLLSERL
ncbi:hypothetical protein D3C85_697700 [compost metagenome]